jgi:hypothetical protein
MMESIPAHTVGRAVRRLVLLGVFALTALQYLYADTILTIAKLPAVIVFAAASMR